MSLQYLKKKKKVKYEVNFFLKKKVTTVLSSVEMQSIFAGGPVMFVVTCFSIATISAIDLGGNPLP